MPLHTQIIRDGKPIKLPNGWGGFHVAAMVMAASIDSARGPWKDMDAFMDEATELMQRQGSIGINPHDVFQLCDYGVMSMTVLNSGPYTMANVNLVFHDNEDGEDLEIRVGDELRAWRN